MIMPRPSTNLEGMSGVRTRCQSSSRLTGLLGRRKYKKSGDERRAGQFRWGKFHAREVVNKATGMQSNLALLEGKKEVCAIPHN
jgi:hypothetical protein